MRLAVAPIIQTVVQEIRALYRIIPAHYGYAVIYHCAVISIMRPLIVICIEIYRLSYAYDAAWHICICCKCDRYSLAIHECFLDLVRSTLVIAQICRISHVYIRLAHNIEILAVDSRRRQHIRIDERIFLHKLVFVRQRPIIIGTVIHIVEEAFRLALLSAVRNSLLVHNTDAA